MVPFTGAAKDMLDVAPVELVPSGAQVDAHIFAVFERHLSASPQPKQKKARILSTAGATQAHDLAKAIVALQDSLGERVHLHGGVQQSPRLFEPTRDPHRVEGGGAAAAHPVVSIWCNGHDQAVLFGTGRV